MLALPLVGAVLAAAALGLFVVAVRLARPAPAAAPQLVAG